MKNTLLSLATLFLMITPQPVWAQAPSSHTIYVDSIMSTLDAYETPDEKVETVIEVAITEQNLDRKILLLHSIENRKLPAHDTVIAKIWYEKSITHLGTGFLDSSNFYINKLIETSKAYKNAKGLISAYNLVAHLDSQKGDFERAINNYFNALEAIEEYTGPRRLENKASILGNLSGVFFHLGDYESALKYVKQELEIEEGLGVSTAFPLVRMAIMEDHRGNFDEAINYGLRAEQELLEGDYKDETLLANCYGTLGSAYIGKNEWNKASYYLERGIMLCRKNGDLTNLFDLLKEQSRVLIAIGNTAKANRLANEALELSRGSEAYGDIQSALEAKINVEKARSNFQSAFNFHVELGALKDSITSIEAKNRIAELRTEFETEKKEAEINRLSLETDLQKAQLRNTRTLLILGGGGALCIVILIVLIYSQRTKKLNAEKEAQELQIEALEKRLIDLNIIPSDFNVTANELNDKINTPLSDREFEVLRLILEGKSNAEIANDTFISVSTVKFHLRNTYGKLGVNNRKEAMQYVSSTS